MRESRYKKGDRLIHIQRKIPFRYLYSEKHNNKSYYIGIDDLGNKIIEEPQMVRMLRKDSNGSYFIFNGMKRYVSRNIVWYHGSNTLIHKFSFNGRVESNDEDGPGIYFTNELEGAKRYGKYIYFVTINKSARELKSSDPVNLEEARKLILKAPDVETGLSNYGQSRDVALQAFFDTNDKTDKKELYDSIWYDFYRDNSKEYLENISILGNDYTKINKTSEVIHLLVYNPNIINIQKRLEI